MTGSNLTLDHILQRSSIRAYTGQALSPPQTEGLKQAVLAAPTARNRQELRYSFITDKELMKAMDGRIFHFCDAEMKETMARRQSDSFFYGAPLVVVISAKDTSWAFQCHPRYAPPGLQAGRSRKLPDPSGDGRRRTLLHRHRDRSWGGAKSAAHWSAGIHTRF